MIDLFPWLSNLVTNTSAAAAQVLGSLTEPGRIGFTVLAIIVGPVVLLTIASIFSGPRTFRIPSLFLGSLIVIIVVIILSFAIGGRVLGFIITP